MLLVYLLLEELVILNIAYFYSSLKLRAVKQGSQHSCISYKFYRNPIKLI